MNGVCYNQVYHVYGLVFELKEPIRFQEKDRFERVVNVEYGYKIIYFYNGKRHEEILPAARLFGDEFKFILDAGQLMIEDRIDTEIVNSF